MNKKTKFSYKYNYIVTSKKKFILRRRTQKPFQERITEKKEEITA